jgi:hypothetical protein
MCPLSNLIIGAVLNNIIFFVQFLCVGGLEILSLCKIHLCLTQTPWESGEILGGGEILVFQVFFTNLGMTISMTCVAVQVMQVQRHII